MEKTINIEVPADEAEKVQVQIQHYFDQIELANERMKKDQAEIERLKARTRAMLAELTEMRAAA